MFLITTILYTMFSLVVIFFFKDNHQTAEKTDDGAAGAVDVKIPQANLWISWIFFIALVVIWTMYEQWASNLSVFMTDQGISMTKYSLLWTLNGILIVVFQLGITWLNRWVNRPYAQVFIGMFTIGFSFVLLLHAHSYSWFVAAMVILTIGEATALPTMPAIVNSLSPVAVKGKYQGILNAFSSIGKAIGPLFGGLMIEATSYHILFIICAVSIFVMEIIVFLVVKIKRARVVEY